MADALSPPVLIRGGTVFDGSGQRPGLRADVLVRDGIVAQIGLDLAAPRLEVAATPALLWPPNHRMVPVRIRVEASDEESGATPTVRLLSVTSSESEGRRADIRILDDTTVLLRAERDNGRQARIYTLTYEAEDAAGNRTVARTTVRVPANRGR